jgi:hypothetical protein
MTLRRVAALIAAPAMVVATLTLMAPAAQAAPTNDDFANAQTLGSTLPVSATGSNVGATAQAGEPSDQYPGPGATVWYRWTAPTDATVGVSTVGSKTSAGGSLDTFLEIYTGTSLTALTSVAYDYDGGTDATSVASFAATSGTTYYLQVDGGYYDDPDSASTGTIALSIAEIDATLSGTVTAASTSAPVVEACVRATSSSYSVAVLTGDDGTYSLSVPAGTYDLLVVNCNSPASLLDATVPGVTVAAHETVTTDVQMADGGSITGTVTGPNGTIPARVCVQAYNADGSVNQFVYTDDSGVYHVGNLPTGSYYVHFTDCGNSGLVSAYYVDQAGSNLVAATAGQITTGTDIQLIQGATVSGTISGLSGAVVTRACAEVYNADFHDTGVVDENGWYQIKGIPAGTYRVVFYEDCYASHPTKLWYGGSDTEAGATTITVTAGQSVTGVYVVFDGGPSKACLGAQASVQSATVALGTATGKLHRDQRSLKKLGKMVKKAKGHAKSKLAKKQKKLKKTVASDKRAVSTATAGATSANAAVSTACH